MKAYQILIKMSTRVGWDNLLKYRSQVFVMEEEYRVHRALMEEKAKRQVLYTEPESDDASSVMNEDASSSESESDSIKSETKAPSINSHESTKKIDDTLIDKAKEGVSSTKANTTKTSSKKNENHRLTNQTQVEDVDKSDAVDVSTMQKVNLNSNSPAPRFQIDNISQSSVEASPIKMLRGLSIDELMRQMNTESDVEEPQKSTKKPPVTQ